MPDTDGFTEAELRHRRDVVRQFGQRNAARRTAGLARPVWDLNHVIVYGQSLSCGAEGAPPLTTSPSGDALMLGASVAPRGTDSPAWQAQGEAVLRPLVATADAGGALGENPVVAAVRAFRARQIDAHGHAAVASRRLVASSCGVGGRRLEALSKGAAPELFNRLRDCVRAVKGASPDSYGLLALLFLQGESDDLTAGPIPPTPYHRYLGGLGRLAADITGDLAAGISGQAQIPAIFAAQITAHGADDGARLAVAMAQLEAASCVPGWHLVGPTYPVTDIGNWHLDADGYRWMGEQFAKVMHRVLTLGETWAPLWPVALARRGAQILIDFQVPAPPLVFGAPFIGRRAVAMADQGFTVRDADDSARLAIRSVEIVSDVQVLITLAQAPPEGLPVWVWYADTAHGGTGCLRDSDPETGITGFGDGPEDFSGQAYPLWNWCVAFRLEAFAG